MQLLIHNDSFTELSPIRQPVQSPKLIPWGWLMASMSGHSLLLLLLVKFATSPESITGLNKQPELSPIIAAQLVTPARIIPKSSEQTRKPIVESRNVEPIFQAIPPIQTTLATPAIPATQAPPPTKTIETPQQPFSFSETTPSILSPSQSRLLSNTTNRDEIQAFFNTYNTSETQTDALHEAANFARAQISPELFAGAPALSPAEQDAKQILDAKIDVDCASDVNKALAIISQFTLHAVVCQDKGNIDVFIQQRLAGKDSRERLQGLKRKQQN